MEQIIVPENVVEYFGGLNIPPCFSLSDVIDDVSQVGRDVRNLLKEVEDLLNYPPSGLPFWFTQSRGLDFDTRRLWVTERLLSEAIAQKRLQVLVEDYEAETKRPYQHCSLAGIVPNSYGLVSLDLFDKNPSVIPGLRRGQTVFEVLPSIPTAVNSMYWVINILFRHKKVETLVRLDPLMRQPAGKYQPINYKMLVYGKPLDWGSLSTIKESLHLRWMPDNGWLEDVEFTDLVWSPRDDGVHFLCEEVPKVDSLQFRPSRYFHAIFDPNQMVFIHCDGAIRIYNKDELKERLNGHVRNIGKIGKRVKVFASQSILLAETWTSLVCAFFVWNRDIEKYFATGGQA